MADNSTEIAKLTVAVEDVTKALQSLAAKLAAAPPDVNTQLTQITNTLTAAVAAAGETVTPTA